MIHQNFCFSNQGKRYLASDPFLKTQHYSLARIMLRPIPMNGIILMKIIFCLLLFCSIGVHLNSLQALQPARWITVLSQRQFAKVFQSTSHHNGIVAVCFLFGLNTSCHSSSQNFSHRRDSVFFHSPIFFAVTYPMGNSLRPLRSAALLVVIRLIFARTVWASQPTFVGMTIMFDFLKRLTQK